MTTLFHCRKNNIPEITISSKKGTTRDFLNVGDAVKGIELALASDFNGEIINIGSGEETSLYDLCNTMQHFLGSNVKINWEEKDLYASPRKYLDISKAKRLLGFEPTVDLEFGIEDVCKSIEGRETEIKDLKTLL